MEPEDNKDNKKFNIEKFFKLKHLFKGKFLIVIVLLAGILMMSFHRVLEKKKYKDAKPYTTKTVQTVQVKNNKLEINEKDLVDLKEFIEENYKGLDMKYAKAFLEAELASKYPDFGEEGLQGIIHIRRSNRETDTKIHPKDRAELKYIDIEEFDAMLKKYAEDGITGKEVQKLKQYYTLTKDEDGNFTGDLKVIYVTKTTTRQASASSSGESSPDIDIYAEKPTITYEIHEKIIPYQILVEQYAMPFQFLLALYQVSSNPEWVKGVADLVLKGSQIIIDIQESETETDEIITDKWTEGTKTIVSLPSEVINPVTNMVEIVNTSSTVYSYTSYTDVSQKIITEESLVANVIYANTWIVEKLQEYNIVFSTTYPQSRPTVTIYNSTETEPSDEGSWISSSTTETTITTNIAQWTKGQTLQQNSNENLFLGLWANELGRYQVPFKEDGTVNEKALYPGNPQMAKTIEYILPSGKKESPIGKVKSEADSGWLFELLQTDESVQNQEQIIKYMLYRITGKVYDGVTSIDFTVFDDKDFLSSGVVGNTSMLKEFIHQFEGSDSTPDGTAYYVHHGGERETPNPTVGYGVNLVVHYYRFEKYGYPITEQQVKEWQQRMVEGEIILNDVTIDKEIVDAVESDIVQEDIKYVENYLSSYNIELTNYQIAALVSRKYQYGNIIGFAAAFYGVNSDSEARNASIESATWTKEDTDKYYRQNVDESIYNHPIYVNFFKDIYEDRRKKEWRLFTTGYNNVTNSYFPQSSEILQVADIIHEHMENIKYQYSLDGARLPNSFEECYTKPYICCATYVSWVLHESGYEKSLTHSSGTLYEQYKDEFEYISNYNELQPGDVVFFRNGDNNSYGFGHVEIYNGDDTWFGAGSDKAITSPAPKSTGNRSGSFWGALRPN